MNSFLLFLSLYFNLTPFILHLSGPISFVSEKEPMLREVECLQSVAIPTKDIDKNGMVSTSLVVTNLLKQLRLNKATEESGYFLSITKLNNIRDSKIHAKCSNVLVSFTCRTLLPMKGEVMTGIVHAVSRLGVFLTSGPMKYIYLSAQKMPNYYFVVDDEKPLFLSNDMSRIEKGLVIRFMVFATRWKEKTHDIHVLASIEGDSLGPVATAGLDGFEL